MGKRKPTGFMLEYDRWRGAFGVEPKERIKRILMNSLPFQKKTKQAGVPLYMGRGVPVLSVGYDSLPERLPLRYNLVPEWNDLLFIRNYQQAYNRLRNKTTITSGLPPCMSGFV